MPASAPLSLPSFAKINWVLKILGRRGDGYHELWTLYQTVDCHDTLSFQTFPGHRIELKVSGASPPAGSDNLVFRAARRLQQAACVRRGVRIRLQKRIPVGAGLGGGSSNAAVTLLGLNHLWKCGLRRHQLAGLAAELGSDVPFFLLGGTVLGRGRGERLRALPDPLAARPLLLVYPPFQISSARAYRLGKWDIYSGDDVLTNERLDTTMRPLHGASDQRAFDWSFLENDFEGVLFKQYPILADIRRRLRQAGCHRVILCGSGSALLATGTVEGLKRASEEVARQGLGQAFVCQTLSRREYRRRVNRSGQVL